MACIRVPKGLDRPYYTNRNRYFIRAGSTKRTASREELMRLFQNAGLYHYDIVELEQAVRGQLNLSQIAAYFERYQIEFATESAEEQERLLQALDVLGAQGHPTVGGLLVFGLQPERLLPQSGVAFAVFAGTELGADLRDKKTFLGPLPQQIDLTLAAIKANLPVPSTIEGTQRIEAPHYPDKVFRELLVNACVHRNYSITGSRIRVFLFDDRLEVISPGRLPNTVSIKKLTVGTSYARNPMLVRLLENLGYVDHLGRGLPMVYQAAKRLQRTVHFEESAEEFRVTLML